MAQGNPTVMISESVDTETFVQAGQRKIDWAKPLMPILAKTAKAMQATEALKGQHIGLGLPIDAKLAVFADVLTQSGARVSCWAPKHAADNDVVNALRANDIAVFIDLAGARTLLSSGIDIILDYDAQLIRLAHLEFPDTVPQFKGATEQTKTGIDRIQSMSDKQTLKTSVINLNDTQICSLFNNAIGVGQSVVMAMLDISNLQIAGRNILVVGYGSVGQGIASHAASLGARVTVAEINPIKAMQAQYNGHTVKSVSEASTKAEVVFLATGRSNVLTADHVSAMSDGVILCSAGSGQRELPMQHFHTALSNESVREQVTDYHFANGKHVLLLANGHCVNIAAGEGNPIEIVDKLLALQLVAIENLMTEQAEPFATISVLPRALEETIAQTHLDFAE